MIQANELRIGNKILYTHPEYESLINTVTVEDIEQCLIDNCGFNKIHAPILLTEEILIKLGFKRLSLNKFSIGSFFIHFEGNLIMCVKSGVLLTTVHQLQNLYFAVMNQELNINNLK
jgi:hypothetical protein